MEYLWVLDWWTVKRKQTFGDKNRHLGAPWVPAGWDASHMAMASVVRPLLNIMPLSLPMFSVSLHFQLSNAGSNAKEIISEKLKMRCTFFTIDIYTDIV